MLNKSDIQWVRNVKRDHGEQLAYYDVKFGENFILHWSKRYVNGKETLKPQIGDIIVLFQKPSFQSNEIQLTHLVTPITNEFEDCHDSNPDYPWGRKVACLARVKDGINSAPSGLNFQSVNQTHSYSIETLGSNFDLDSTRSLIWETFKGSFNPNFSNRLEEMSMPESDPEIEAIEGRERWRLKLHRLRERDSEIINAKKKESDLRCECCRMNFEMYYGQVGQGFIECHHRIPIMNGERITKLADLALVCSNCHRMLHRKKEDGEYHSVESLKTLIEGK